MAGQALTGARLPGESDLRSFATAAAQLLIERLPRAPGARTVSRRAGVGHQHLDHREYAPGDDVRHIDWRQTARRRQPIVRRFESEITSDWTILLDASSSMAHGAGKWQAAVHTAAAMSYALLALGHRVGLLAFGERVLSHCPGGRGQRHYAAIARLLTALQPAYAGERSALGACAPFLRGATTVFAISDFLAHDEMRGDLGAILQRCAALHVLQVRDAAETRLREAGEFDLVDVETGTQMPAEVGARADALAAGERTAMTARLRGFCARSGAAFTDFDIGQAWQQALLRHLLRARSSC